MKQYYESEVLYQLMERDGFNIPSSVPPYESEIKAYLINQVKQAYPKLTDYEAEWLLYNYTKHLPADFPVSYASDVTNATFNNVVPFAFQSAILKGQTLVNLGGTYNKTDAPLWISVFTTQQEVERGSVYYAIINNTGNGLMRLRYKTSDAVIKAVNPLSCEKFIFTATESDYLRIKNSDTISNCDGTFLLLKYQDGMENWDIPYFEGMQSVKMPVLTTSNEDDTKSNILTVNEDVTLRGIGKVKDELNLLTGELTQRIGKIVLDGSDIAYTSNNNYMTEVSTSILTSTFSNCNVYQPIMCKDFPVYFTLDAIWEKDKGIVSGVSFVSPIWGFCIRLPHTLTGVTTADSEDSVKQKFKAYLQSNPITIQYQLETESIKTVELTTVNENGESVHFMPLEGTMYVHSSGEIIPPTFDMSVPVEATTQNLASFVDLQMEE